MREEPLREDQIRRYARHVLLPDVGGTGQKRILAATVVAEDAGGAGAAAICYLAAAGVGTIVVRDGGVVRPEDVGALYEAGDVGRPRLDAAKDRVAALNPDVTVAASGEGLALPVVAVSDGVEAIAEGAAAAGRLLRAIVSG